MRLGKSILGTTPRRKLGTTPREISIGIDPGLRGGMAMITEIDDAVVDVQVIPTPILPSETKKQNGKTKRVTRDRYDLPAIARQLGEWYTGNVIAFVEEPIPMPPQVKRGSLAQFQRGVAFGFAWMLTALEIPFVLVHPKTWQAPMLKGLPKNDRKKQSSILACQRLFPTVDLRRTELSRLPHDGLAEALLIAEYGRSEKNKPRRSA